MNSGIVDSLIKHTICVGGPRAHTKQIAVDSGGVVVDVVELWAGLVPACDHGTHAETITAILIPE